MKKKSGSPLYNSCLINNKMKKKLILNNEIKISKIWHW
jgi:hypothetical protein